MMSRTFRGLGAPGTWHVLAVLLVFIWPIALAGQDVLVQGLDQNIQPPPWILEILRDNPDAFRFQNAWKAKAKGVRQARELMELQMGPDFSGPEGPNLGPVLTGTYGIPVLPALYSDIAAPHSQAAIDDRLFGSGSGMVSLTALYTEMSRGVFTFDGTVVDWLALPNASAFYEPTSDPDDLYGELWAFLSGTLDLADPLIDFGQFDNDGPDGVPNSGDDDGFVDTVAFLYGTKAMSCGGPGIWPHRWVIPGARLNHGDGVADYYYTTDVAAGGGFIRVSDYIIQSAVQCDGTSLMGSGTISHELGHALDLPDLYDTSDSDTDPSNGIGHWGLMGSGNWNTQTSPAHLSAWSKDQLGWVSVSAVSSTTTGISLSSVQSAGNVLRIDLPGSDEFFLLSNRRAVGSDQYLHESGLLIWHIDPSVTDLRYDVNADPYHKGVDVEEADGQDDLDAKNNRGDDGDPYPGSSGAHEFTTLTYPYSDPYAARYCTVGVRSIQESGSNILLDIEPSERYVLWGDVDGTRDLSNLDRHYIYVAAGFGYVYPENQGIEGNGDLDNDGDVDLRDGLIFDSQYRGVTTAPGSRYGDDTFLSCVPLPAPGQSGLGLPEVNRIVAPVPIRR